MEIEDSLQFPSLLDLTKFGGGVNCKSQEFDSIRVIFVKNLYQISTKLHE